MTTPAGELAALTAALAGWLATTDHGADRIARAWRRAAPDTPGEEATRSLVEDGRRRTALCVVACSVLGWAIGGVGGLGLGVLGGVLLTWWLSRLEPPSVSREREALARDLPLAVDLLAACADVGLPVQSALPSVAGAVRGPLAVRLATLSSRLALGASPVDEWERIAADPHLAGLGRAMVRAHRSGAPVAVTLGRLAADRRRERRAQLQATARSVGVKVAAPLAACFLPAFMLIGVVPTVVGGFTHLGL